MGGFLWNSDSRHGLGSKSRKANPVDQNRDSGEEGAIRIFGSSVRKSNFRGEKGERKTSQRR